MKFFERILICALSLGLAAYLVPGIHVNNLMTLVIAAFLFGLVNAVIRPVLVVLTLPINILTLGLFLFIINALMLVLVAWILPGFSINSIISALLGWLIMSVSGWVASKLIT
jgi:putative membrane protein